MATDTMKSTWLWLEFGENMKFIIKASYGTFNVTDNSISPWVMATCRYSTAEWLIKIQTNDFLGHNRLPLHGLILGIVLSYELHKISVSGQHDKQSTGTLQANACMKEDGHGTLPAPG